MSCRLPITAAVAVILASFSLFTVILGADWLYAGAGAALVVAAAGVATRLAPIPAAAAAAGLVLIAAVPLLAWPSWAARIAGLVLIAAVACSAGTRRILPALADVGTYLAALLIYLNLVFAGPESLGWIIPTARSMRHLGTLVSLGYAEHNYAPPVPGSHGLELITAAGIGAVAILTDVLAVRMRSPAVAGLPLLVLFSVPVATNVKHVGLGFTLAFCLGITGYLTLLAADGRERLRLWGRLVTVWQEAPEDEDAHGPDTRALAASGRRIGLAAVALAVVIPLVLPGLKEHGLLGKDAAPGGDSQVAAPRPLVEMNSQLLGHTTLPVLTYRTNAFEPRQQYLQVYVLNFDAATNQWLPTSRYPSSKVGPQALRSPPGLSSAVTSSTTRTAITMGSTSGYRGQLTYLPLPYAPEFLTVPGTGWQETNSTLMVYGDRPDGSLLYTVTSKTATPTPSQLPAGAKIPASIADAYLGYAGPNRVQLTRIARSITSGAHTQFARATAMENYFSGSGLFTYSLRGNLPGSVYQFLTSDRRGYCQQFAFAMAVLARLIGIPSRIAVGYTAGTPAGHHTWKVTTADAHAWPELYFPGAGWLRFEPTPGGPGGQGTATKPVYTAPATGGAAPTGPVVGPTSPVPGTTSGRAGSLPRGLRPGGLGGQAGGGRHGGAGSGGFPVGLLVALIAALLIISPGLTRVATRRRRWLTATGDSARAHAAWRELTSDLVDHGLGGALSESPRAVARRVAGAADLDEPARQAISRIAAAEERARYARTPAAAGSLRADVHTVRRAIARDATRSQRWRARLLPASTLAPVLAALRQAPDAFGWLDAAGLRVRRSLRRHPVQARRAD